MIRVALALALACGVASAQETGIAADRFAPGIGPVTLLGVDGAEVTPFRDVSFTLSLGYLRDPIRLENRFSHETFSTPVRGQLVSDVSLEAGIWKRLALAVGAPFVLWADGDRLRGTGDDRPLGSPVAGDLRLRAKAAFVGDPAKPGLHLGVMLQVGVPLGGQSDFAATGSVTVEPRLIADVRVWRLVILAALGARFAGERQLFQTRFSDELVWFAGALVHAVPEGALRVDVMLELAGAVGPSDGTRPIELRGGLRGAFGRFAIDLGAGAGLLRDAGAPSLRVLAVFRARFGG